jgi:hypothetical protein
MSKEYCSTVHNSQEMKPKEVPINERLGEENVVHMHNRILFNHKKE